MSIAPLTPDLTRALRADAARNRERILDAASAAFADEGFEAQMPAIAQRAGVGVGTLYRHFPTKLALCEALAAAHFDWITSVVEACDASDAGDAFKALHDCLWHVARETADSAAMCEAVGGTPEAFPTVSAAQQRLVAATQRLIDRAKAEGTIRPDAEVADIRTMMSGFGQVAANQRAGAPVDWRRYMTIMLDGLRAQPRA